MKQRIVSSLIGAIAAVTAASAIGAPGTIISWALRPGMGWTVTPRPPIRFALPGRIWSVVTPAGA